jgi:NAD(P) transhydrogenase subunit alpha
MQGAVTWPPPPPKIAGHRRAPEGRRQGPGAHTSGAARAGDAALPGRDAAAGRALVVGTVLLGLIGLYAPQSFMSHFIVFALACFVGFQVIWGVSHALHTPLMAVTNAISGIIILGALLQVGSGHWLIVILAAVSILIATINIVGGFLVTRRMLAMFQRS